jgi:DNA-binding response OmpR family regulator
MMTMLLKSPSRQIRTAPTGEAALEAARELQPDIVLLDLSLPDISGYEVAQRLREIDGVQSCVLIAISGHASPEDRELAIETGFDHYLVKPVDLDELEELVSRHA